MWGVGACSDPVPAALPVQGGLVQGRGAPSAHRGSFLGQGARKGWKGSPGAGKTWPPSCCSGQRGGGTVGQVGGDRGGLGHGRLPGAVVPGGEGEVEAGQVGSGGRAGFLGGQGGAGAGQALQVTLLLSTLTRFSALIEDLTGLLSSGGGRTRGRRCR